MGIRLKKDSTEYPASIENGILTVYHFENIVFEYDLGIPRSMVFEKQCNHLRTPLNRVSGFFKNDKFFLVIRFDGSLEIFTKEFVLVYVGMTDIDKYLKSLEINVYNCGLFRDKDGETMCNICEVKGGNYMLHVAGKPISIMLDEKDVGSSKLISSSKLYVSGSICRIFAIDPNYNNLIVDFGGESKFDIEGHRVISSN